MEKCVDYGDAPTFLATGICRIFFISRHIVRVTCVRTDIDENGTEHQRVSGHVDWDLSDLQAAHALIHEALAQILSSRPSRRPANMSAAHRGGH
jgi:hypothetical protein